MPNQTKLLTTVETDERETVELPSERVEQINAAYHAYMERFGEYDNSLWEYFGYFVGDAMNDPTTSAEHWIEMQLDGVLENWIGEKRRVVINDAVWRIQQAIRQDYSEFYDWEPISYYVDDGVSKSDLAESYENQLRESTEFRGLKADATAHLIAFMTAAGYLES